jgi:hypothetical protein
MTESTPSPVFRLLTGYYGILQSIHLLLLIRAGWFFVQGWSIPFPAPPPLSGWPESSMPFLIGMGLVDIIAIGLGLIFVGNFFFKGKALFDLGIISLSLALASGLIYLVGTIPSGAWEANLAAYLVVVFLFGPVLPFFFMLIKKAQRS